MDEQSPLYTEPTSVVRSYAELVRLPLWFTAMADVVMGFLVTHPEIGLSDAKLLALLVAASTALYAAGMVLNDVFDAAVDAEERSHRPIPSGRVSLGAARLLGWGLLISGIGLAVTAAIVAGNHRPALAAVALACCVVLYDGWLKSGLVGPVAMGSCRAFNVLLGMSVPMTLWEPGLALIPAAIGTYITGVTWFARGEADESNQTELAMATLVILFGIALAAAVPFGLSRTVPMLEQEPWRWYVLLGALGGFTCLRCFQAIREPDAERVQMTVTRLIHSLVFLNAILCFTRWDIPGAIAVLLFLFPTMFLVRWLYST